MNEQQPYEKYLAEKFQQLPLPDVEPNWQQMKSLLDKEMPRGGGYWRWITGIGLLLIMLGGTWYFTSVSERNSPLQMGETRTVDSTNQIILPNNSQEITPEKVADEKTEGTASEKNSPVQSNVEQLNQPVNSKNIEENLQNNSVSETPSPSDKINRSGNNDLPRSNDRYQGNSDNVVEETNPRDEPLKGGPVGLGKNINAGKKDIQPGNQVVSNDQGYSSGEITSKNSPVYFEAQNSVPGITTDELIVDSIVNDYSADLFPEAKPDKLQKSGKSSGKTKSAKSAAMDAGEDKNLAFGFSLPMGFPLGDQKPGAYNINAKPNTVSDFLPVPHMQYHINNKVYLQTEVQLMNPQFIQPVLLYQNRTEYPSTNTIHYNSVYAKKLYYFNIPVGIHYSPFKHFYLGTGLQFSSLISGVAMQEESSFAIGPGRYTLLNQQHSKFKNDSISDRIDNSEFRLMLDANYYWKQFTVGLRYNQALSNYVSFRLNTVSPLFQDKNKSLQFYLRYNLWEDHKRKKK